MNLKEFYTPDVIYCTADITTLHAARIMRERHVGDLVVIDDSDEGQAPMGIVTDRDIVVEVLAKELDPAQVTVREIMRLPLVIARASEEVEHALERMRVHGVRRVPVLDEASNLVGVLSLDDLVRRLAAEATALADIIAHEQDRERRTRR